MAGGGIPGDAFRLATVVLVAAEAADVIIGSSAFELTVGARLHGEDCLGRPVGPGHVRWLRIKVAPGTVCVPQYYDGGAVMAFFPLEGTGAGTVTV